MTAIFGYKKPLGHDEAYWYGKIGGHDRKFVRVLCGVALPILDRMSGAAVVIAETFHKTQTQDLWCVAATVGRWPQLENSLIEYREKLKFDHIICDIEQARPILMRIPQLWFGLHDIPLCTDVGPEYSCSEVGQSRVNQLILEGRLHGFSKNDDFYHILSDEAEQGMKALCAVICWANDLPAIYNTKKPQPRMGRVLGIEGL